MLCFKTSKTFTPIQYHQIHAYAGMHTIISSFPYLTSLSIEKKATYMTKNHGKKQWERWSLASFRKRNQNEKLLAEKARCADSKLDLFRHACPWPQFIIQYHTREWSLLLKRGILIIRVRSQATSTHSLFRDCILRGRFKKLNQSKQIVVV